MYLNRSRLAGAASLLLLALLVCSLVAGCGGARQAADPTTPGTGSALIAIDWPARETEQGRAIPANANSIVIRVFTGEEHPHLRRVISRPSSAGTVAVRLDGLPLGPVLFVAEAFSDTAGLAQPPLASGSQTVTVGREAPVTVNITLAPLSSGSGGAATTAYATVVVADIPATAASVVVRVLQNGTVIEPEGAPPAIPRSLDLPFTAVPLRLGPLPASSLLFIATAKNAAGGVVASGSTIASLTAGAETSVSLPLTPGSGGGSGAPSASTGGAVLNVSNVGTGDALLVVDPMPGDRTLTDPPPVQVPLQGAFVQSGLPITRVPVMVAGLSPGPWLFVVTTHRGLQVSDEVNRVGTATATVTAGDLLNLELPLGSAQSAAPPRQDGDLVVRTANITPEGVQIILVAVFDSTGRIRQQIIPHTPGVIERLAEFALPGGPYTVVAAAYGGPAFSRDAFDQTLAADTTTIPPGALAIGSTTVSVSSGAAAEAVVELRSQGDAGSGSVNLAMLNVPVAMEKKEAAGVAYWVITSSVLVKVFSLRDNQEIPSLRQVMVPPSSGLSGDLLISPTAQYDQLRPLRLRIDGVPMGQMRFEVTAMRGADGTGAVMGRGSTVVNIATGVQPVTVTVLPHGDLDPNVVLPGIGNDPHSENPPPAKAAPIFRWRRVFAR